MHTDMRFRRSYVRGYPYEMIVDPNNYCNLRCPLCPTGQRVNERPYGKMPISKYKGFLAEVAPHLFKLRFYNWGEPLLLESIYDMVALAQEKNVGTQISSNLSFDFNEEDADRMIHSGLEFLKVSLDSVSPETYPVYRVGGDFKKVVRNVETIVQRKKELRSRTPAIEIQFIVMRHNEHELGSIEALRTRIGADQVRVGGVIINVRDVEQRCTYLPTNPAFSRYDYENFEDKMFRSAPPCHWLWSSAVVNWDGTVSPCCIFEGPKTDMGNIFKEGSFRAVWNGPVYRPAVSARS